MAQGATVTISGLTFTDSKTSNGFIFNEGTLTLNYSTVSRNTASGPGVGGGISNGDGTLTLNYSTVSDNSASSNGDSGGISNGSGTLTLNYSTVSGNTASNGSGGGVSNQYGGTLTLNNSTISGNTAGSSGGGIFISGYYGQPSITPTDLTFNTIYGNTAHDGGDIAIKDFDLRGKPIKQLSQVRISNSIVAGDPAHPGPDIIGMLTSHGYNLFQDNSGATFDPATSTKHGTDKTLSVNDLKIDPVLRDNGGSTKPHTLTNALLRDSPAIDAVPLQYCQVKAIFNSQSKMYTDQRGVKRPDKNEAACDIGAYEYADSST